MAELPLPSRSGCWVVAILAALAIAWVALSLAGLVLVRDRTGQVVRATLVSGGGGASTQALLDLPGGYFVAIPQIEGTVEIECLDGSRHQNGYVTGAMQTWLTVEPGCRLREEG